MPLPFPRLLPQGIVHRVDGWMHHHTSECRQAVAGPVQDPAARTDSRQDDAASGADVSGPATSQFAQHSVRHVSLATPTISVPEDSAQGEQSSIASAHQATGAEKLGQEEADIEQLKMEMLARAAKLKSINEELESLQSSVRRALFFTSAHRHVVVHV